jgi:hypothetical protein
MDNLNLSSDESVIKKIQQIIISGARYTAVFTSSRLVLVERETGRIHKSILFSEMVQAVQDMNALREPVIRLTFTPAGKETEIAELIFFSLQRDQNSRECNSCMEIFKDHQVPVQGTGPMVVMNRYEMAGSGHYGEVTSSGRPAVPDFSLIDSHRAPRNPPPGEEQKRPAPLTIALVIIVIVIIIGGIVLAGPAMTVKKPPVPATTAPPATTPTLTPAVVTPVSTVTTDSSVPSPVVPPYGVWIRIAYPGNYTGHVKAEGTILPINSSGTWIRQLAVQNTLIEGMVEKTDGSGESMEVMIYNGGNLIFRATTSKPHGMVDVHVATGPVAAQSPTPLPEQTIDLVPTPDTSLVLQPVPASGVFVQVIYPGNFSGSISAEGYRRTVNSSGVQLYQIPLRSGIVTGFFGKSDGSVKNLLVQVLRDGTMVSYANTSVPFGVAQIHAAV